MLSTRRIHSSWNLFLMWKQPPRTRQTAGDQQGERKMATSYPTENRQERVKTADEPLFETGRVVCTPPALEVLTDVDVAAALY